MYFLLDIVVDDDGNDDDDSVSSLQHKTFLNKLDLYVEEETLFRLDVGGA